MASLNVVHIIGNLTRDVELKYTPKGTAVAEIGLAVNRKYKTDSDEQRDETTWVDCTLWGRTAEIVAEYCKKGSPLYVGGRLSLDTWDDKATGQKRSKLKVVGDNIQLLGGKGEDSGSRPQGEHSSRPPANRAPAQRPPADRDLDPSDEGSSIPF